MRKIDVRSWHFKYERIRVKNCWKGVGGKEGKAVLCFPRASFEYSGVTGDACLSSCRGVPLPET